MVPMAGIWMVTTYNKPVTMSQMPNKSIPRFFVRFILFTSLSEKRDSQYRSTKRHLTCS
jgi:hypothetical protein